MWELTKLALLWKHVFNFLTLKVDFNTAVCNVFLFTAILLYNTNVLCKSKLVKVSETRKENGGNCILSLKGQSYVIHGSFYDTSPHLVCLDFFPSSLLADSQTPNK